MSMRRRLDCKIQLWAVRRQMYDGSNDDPEIRGTSKRLGLSRRLQDSSKINQSKCV
jgi:hypothetical protein